MDGTIAESLITPDALSTSRSTVPVNAMFHITEIVDRVLLTRDIPPDPDCVPATSRPSTGSAGPGSVGFRALDGIFCSQSPNPAIMRMKMI